NEPATRQALADVVVAVAFELERDALGEERTETLPRRAVELDVYGVVGQRTLAPDFDDLVAQHRADSTVDIDDRELELHALTVVNGIATLFDEAPVQGPIEAVILLLRAIDRLRCLLRGLEYRREIETIGLPMSDRFARLEHVDAPDHVHQAAEAEAGHDLAHFLGHQDEIIHDVFRLARKLSAQHGVLSRDADGTGVQVA